VSDRSESQQEITIASEGGPPDHPAANPALGQTIAFSEAGHSVLHALGQKLPEMPRVVLRDEAGSVAEPVVQSQSCEMPSGKSDSRYQLHGEIARGGMGAILKGRDTDLGRDLAIKVLLDSHKDKPEVVQRFVEEAQIGGQLQHPGIVPVYELGQFADERPFFSMKLVKGHTLSSLLAARKTPADDRTRFLGIFQQICQTMAYAHSRGVIHRDLKPANIMVGAFGEVQVMDWGLAKVLAAGGVINEKKAHQQVQDASVIRTVHKEGSSGASSGSHTLDGSVMGTPAYMSPEQAMGEVDRLDERADVFGLGAILCEILTDRPPYTGRDSTQVFRLAARGNLNDAFSRLAACGAEQDLIELARQCLAAEPDERPRHAGVVAQRISDYLASVESRLRAVEVQAAAESARAEEAQRTAAEQAAAARAERRARRLQLGLALAVLSMTGLAGVAALWAAIYQNGLKQEIEVENTKVIAAQKAETNQRLRAESEKTRADLTLADMQTARGLLAAERDAPAEAALWFATASEQSAEAKDQKRQDDNYLRAGNWLRQAVLPVGVLSLDEFAAQLDFQPGGDLLLARSDRGNAFLWSWREGRLVDWCDGLAGVGAVAFSRDGLWLAIGLDSGDVQIRTVADGSVVDQCAHGQPVHSLAFSPWGLLAIGGQTVRIWDTARKKFFSEDLPHPQPVVHLTFNREGDRLITACYDKLARVYDVSSDPNRSAPLFAPVPHMPLFSSLPALTDHDRTLVTISATSQLARWDIATGGPASPATIDVKSNALTLVVASANGRWLATGGSYGPEVYDLLNQQPPLYLGHTNLVKNFSFSPDSTLLLSTSWDLTARLWSLPDGRPLGAPLPHMANVEHCAWSNDGMNFATAQGDGLIRVWQLPLDDLVTAEVGPWGECPRVSFDGRLVAPGIWHEAPFTNNYQRLDRLQVIVADDGRPMGEAIALPGVLVDSCVCADNRSVAAVCLSDGKGLFGVWDIATARRQFEPVALPSSPNSVAARSASSQIAVLCRGGELLVFDGRTGHRELELCHVEWFSEGTRRPYALYTPDSKTLVTLGDGVDTTINVRDADTGQLRCQPIRPVLTKNYAARGFTLSADSRMLATIVNGQNAAQVWDLATGRALSEPLPHPGDHYGLFSACFSPDGRRLLTVCKDGQARYWDWEQGVLACPPMAHADEVYDAAITPDGRFALTAVRGQVPCVHFWELTTGKRIAPPQSFGNSGGSSSHHVAITPDGKRGLVGHSGTTLGIVNLEALLSPSPSPPPAADLARWAELASAEHIELGDLSKLDRQQWQARWDSLREHDPSLVTATVTRQSPRSAMNDPRSAAVQPSAETAADAVHRHMVAGNLLARWGKWGQAAKEAIELVEANPGDRFTWSQTVPRMVLAGDVEAYRRLCGRMVEQFAMPSEE